MKPAAYLNNVQKALNSKDGSVESPFDLILRNGDLVCSKGKDLLPNDVLVVKITHLQLSQGFSSAEWEKMFCRMNAYFSRSR